MLKRFYDWLVTSSADPTKLALTIKGLLGVLVSVLVLVSPIFGWSPHIGSEQVDTFTKFIVEFITQTSIVVSACVTFYGFIRKIYLTFKNP